MVVLVYSAMGNILISSQLHIKYYPVKQTNKKASVKLYLVDIICISMINNKKLDFNRQRQDNLGTSFILFDT